MTLPAGSTQGLTEMADLVLGAASVWKQAKAAGPISIQDITLLLQLVPLVGPAAQDAGDVSAELKALTTDQAEALVAHIMAKLSLSNQKAQDVAAAVLKAGVAAFELVKALEEPAKA